MTKVLLARGALVALFCISCASASYSQVSTGTQAGASVPLPPAEQPAAVPEGASGMKAYIDPQTGAIRTDAAPGTEPLPLTPQERNALSTSHDGLVQVPSSVLGGGVKLDLQGRFQSPLIATIDANGKVKTQHLGETPEPREHK
jgi:hypothetical protein